MSVISVMILLSKLTDLVLRRKMQNALDKLIERKAFEYFSAQGVKPSLIQFKIKELLIGVQRGYFTRAEIITLIKKADSL